MWWCGGAAGVCGGACACGGPGGGGALCDCGGGTKNMFLNMQNMFLKFGRLQIHLINLYYVV